ncbi:UDP-galactose 4-epimerase [Gonapodya prolifera JEL478]|uniref:UDP-glucose 4-epimerase n=1 Tax=Gonapodya prolifera (strain JEL478) TaxID=1344416 RepID=A0A139AYJ9_GONPJ|nr:UDP-galactose 4-epimerase [Gonapodya prolifera JEL478]|eukprot:KXS21806.1 UDP-galactose 4-epimerase [Gonapodya prolifera JEL478]
MFTLRRLFKRGTRSTPDADDPASASPSPAAPAASEPQEPLAKTATPAILVTGGCGYIGTHTLVELLSRGFEVIVVDDLSNSSNESTRRAEKIGGKKVLATYNISVCDGEALRDVFRRHSVEAVIHFAGLKSVTESTSNPLKYYNINVGGMVTLLEVMKEFSVFNLVFSSSATVYGHPQVEGPIDEDHPVAPTNPYGRTKLMCEDIAKDLAASDSRFKIALLRYFNPIGAHSSGLIGEDPNDIPNNLIPYVTQVLVGRLPFLRVYGDDYKTVDGTGVRDFIHVSDLALGHVSAVEYLRKQIGSESDAKDKSKENLWIWNMGTGRGFSVLEVVRAIEKAAGKNVPVVMSSRRPGDCGEVIANTTKANSDLGWSATRGIEEMAATAWLFQSTHPDVR